MYSVGTTAVHRKEEKRVVTPTGSHVNALLFHPFVQYTVFVKFDDLYPKHPTQRVPFKSTNIYLKNNKRWNVSFMILKGDSMVLLVV